MNIEEIQDLCKSNKLRWTNHIFVRLVQRNISMADVKHAIRTGEIIESYPDDYPYPSCLVLGINVNNVHIHVVCGSDGEELWLITAYYPDPTKWSEDLKNRKGQ